VSLPTPNTHELLRVVVNWAVGAAEIALLAAVAPIAPDPFVPEVSTLAKLTTVSDAGSDADSVAVTVTLVNGAEAKARQISAVPRWTFVPRTEVHVRPAPVTPVTLIPVVVPPTPMNASTS